MLRPIANARQHPGEPRRLWFFSHEQDLYVWLGDSGEVVAFQLCYGKDRDEHAIWWKAGRGFLHLKVDAGNRRGLRSGTPLLEDDGIFDPGPVVSAFLALAAELPPDLVAFVAERLSAPGIPSGGNGAAEGA